MALLNSAASVESEEPGASPTPALALEDSDCLSVGETERRRERNTLKCPPLPKPGCLPRVVQFNGCNTSIIITIKIPPNKAPQPPKVLASNHTTCFGMPLRQGRGT